MYAIMDDWTGVGQERSEPGKGDRRERSMSWPTS